MIESINLKPLVIQEGRRYVMRYGGITGVITKDGSGFIDGIFRWFNDGRYYSDRENGRDLIAEYIPQPESLPFVLKAGAKYETDTGEIVTLVSTYPTHLSGWHELVPFVIEWIGKRRYLVTPSGECVTEVSPLLKCRIVREHVPQLTPIERLESQKEALDKIKQKAVSECNFDTAKAVRECELAIKSIIADLKAVKP
jgi:hypothetical protein